jgi:hypothetical protein
VSVREGGYSAEEVRELERDAFGKGWGEPSDQMRKQRDRLYPELTALEDTSRAADPAQPSRVAQAIRLGAQGLAQRDYVCLSEAYLVAKALLNTPEIEDFARGIVLEAAHQRQRWEDSWKKDFDWHAVATYLLAKALLNPAQNDGTTGKHARLHRLVAAGALVANWHAAVLARPDDGPVTG